jgi:hypothetical protein
MQRRQNTSLWLMHARHFNTLTTNPKTQTPDCKSSKNQSARFSKSRTNRCRSENPSSPRAGSPKARQIHPTLPQTPTQNPPRFFFLQKLPIFFGIGVCVYPLILPRWIFCFRARFVVVVSVFVKKNEWRCSQQRQQEQKARCR